MKNFLKLALEILNLKLKTSDSKKGHPPLNSQTVEMILGWLKQIFEFMVVA